MINCKSYFTGFSGLIIEIGYNDIDAKSLLDFLLRDLKVKPSATVDIRYDVLITGRPQKFSLWQGEKQIYFGNGLLT